jgi:hypothetical protein
VERQPRKEVINQTRGKEVLNHRAVPLQMQAIPI